MFTIGRTAFRQEGVFFLIENALSAGKGDGSAERAKYAIYDCRVITSSIARSATRRYLSYSEADFEAFRPALATSCTYTVIVAPMG